jgi:hypothetical protein
MVKVIYRQNGQGGFYGLCLEGRPVEMVKVIYHQNGQGGFYGL